MFENPILIIRENGIYKIKFGPNPLDYKGVVYFDTGHPLTEQRCYIKSIEECRTLFYALFKYELTPIITYLLGNGLDRSCLMNPETLNILIDDNNLNMIKYLIQVVRMSPNKIYGSSLDKIFTQNRIEILEYLLTLDSFNVDVLFKERKLLRFIYPSPISHINTSEMKEFILKHPKTCGKFY